MLDIPGRDESFTGGFFARRRSGLKESEKAVAQAERFENATPSRISRTGAPPATSA
jgi:hypothetical protein